MISVDARDASGDERVNSIAICGDGSTVVFTPRACNLLPPPASQPGGDRVYLIAATGGQAELVGNRANGGMPGIGDAAASARLSGDGSVVTHPGDCRDPTAPGASAPGNHSGLVMRSVAGAGSEVWGVAPHGGWIEDGAGERDFLADASGERIRLVTSAPGLAPTQDLDRTDDLPLLTRIDPEGTLFADGFQAPAMR